MFRTYIALLAFAMSTSIANAAFTEKYTVNGGFPFTKDNVVVAQLDADPALEILVNNGCRIQIVDGETGEAEFDKLTNCGSYPGNIRTAVLDVDSDGLIEVVFTMTMYSSGVEMPNKLVVVDTDVSVSEVQPWDNPGLGELRTVPEPMKSALELTIDMAEAGPAAVRIVDVTGRLIREVSDEDLPAGRTTLRWDGKDRHGNDAASGVYFVQVTSDEGTASRRITIVR